MSFRVGAGAHTVRPSAAAFPVTLADSCIGSVAAEPQYRAHMDASVIDCGVACCVTALPGRCSFL